MTSYFENNVSAIVVPLIGMMQSYIKIEHKWTCYPTQKMKKKVVKVSRFGENSLPILSGPTTFFSYLGPRRLSGGQRSCLLLWRSEFKSCSLLNWYEETEINKKEAGVGPFPQKKFFHTSPSFCLQNLNRHATFTYLAFWWFINKGNPGQWLWQCWHGGRFWHQRSTAQIPTLAKNYLSIVLYRKDENKEKEAGIGPFKK